MAREDIIRKDGIPQAPNGRPSNLSPEDWAYVRTDEFKSFFGDWEAREYILSDRYVCLLSGNEFQKDEVLLTEKVPEFYIRNGDNIIHRAGLGTVVLDAEGVRDSIAHGIGRLKSAAFAAVPDVVKKGMVVQKASNYKGKDVDSCVLMAPVKIADEGFTAIVLLKKGKNADKHRFYLHEVVMQKNLLEESFKTGIKAAPFKENDPAVHDGDLAKLLKKILSASKVVDENGEPRVLYHGTTRDFEKFDTSHAGENTGLVEYTDPKTGEKIRSDSNAAMFFTDYEPQAVSYAMLGRLQEVSEIRRAAQAVATSIRSGQIGGYISRYKSKDEFWRDVERLTPMVPSLGALPATVSTFPQEKRDAIAADVFALRDEYYNYEREMSNGGMSNQYNNTLCQGRVVERLIGDFDRMRKNDATVRGEFGTLEEYNVSLFGESGNSEIYIDLDRDCNRIRFISPETGHLYLDAIDDAMAEKCKYLMRRTQADAVKRFNGEVRKGGYDVATRVYSVFLKAEHPFEHDYGGSAFPDKYIPNEKYPTAYVAARQVRRALKDGCDMVVYRNIRDPFRADSYGVFSGDQVLVRDVRRGVRINDTFAVNERSERALMLDYGFAKEDVDRLYAGGSARIKGDTFPRRSTPESPYDPANGTVKTDVSAVVDREGRVFVKDGKRLVAMKEFLESGRKRTLIQEEKKTGHTLEITKSNNINR